ncbi:hypothetical protein H0H81_011749 [Sphagnurus paluster]|uniref:Uncharacterized protein n=1 Tax=Sphagnurus paluster TaxID=117069 RepID=A0A9P7GV55_9AGAR|nr:hypothetical protein H0H81_011749 [Sphagnurus paluster]
MLYSTALKLTPKNNTENRTTSIHTPAPAPTRAFNTTTCTTPKNSRTELEIQKGKGNIHHQREATTREKPKVDAEAEAEDVIKRRAERAVEIADYRIAIDVRYSELPTSSVLFKQFFPLSEPSERAAQATPTASVRPRRKYYSNEHHFPLTHRK